MTVMLSMVRKKTRNGSTFDNSSIEKHGKHTCHSVFFCAHAPCWLEFSYPFLAMKEIEPCDIPLYCWLGAMRSL